MKYDSLNTTATELQYAIRHITKAASAADECNSISPDWRSWFTEVLADAEKLYNDLPAF